MSYREIRNLIEHTKVLGFHRVISMENFSTPNFPLVSEILMWAMKVVDSEYEVSSIIEFEPDRVLLIRMAAVFFYQKMGIKVNTVKLYGADKLAVRELLKVTTSLYKAIQTVLHSPPPSNEDGSELEENLTVSLNGKDLREFRKLASSIVMDAAALHDSLNNEVDDKIKRDVTLNQALDIDRLEATLVSALHALSATVAELKEATQQLEKQEVEVAEKLLKKRECLVRNIRRLEALNRIKPAWQTEFEDEEAELRSVWEEYVTKHKNLAYLENQLQELEDQQLRNLDVAMQRAKEAATTDLRETPVKEQVQTQSRRFFGSMTGDGLDTSDSEATDSFLNDSASDDDSLTLLSKDESREAALALRKDTPLSKTRENLIDHSLYAKPAYKSLSGRQVQRRPSSARPKSAHTESKVNNLSVWTGSVKGSGRVSPLSASEDNSDDGF